MTAAPDPRVAVAPVFVDPAADLGEQAMLLAYLQRQRSIVGWKLADVDPDVLQSAATPSGLRALGVLRHLTNVERSWVQERFLGRTGLAYDWTDDDPDAEFWVPPRGADAAALVAEYLAEGAATDAVLGSTALDARTVDGRFTARWLLLHLIEETARHLGHLDVLRELADGAVGEEPPGVRPPAGAADRPGSAG